MTRVVLVRPWRDAGTGAGGCCSVDAAGIGPVAAATDRHGTAHAHGDADTDVVAAAYRLLRARLPGVDVQVVTAGNTGYLLPTTYRSLRARLGRLAALRAAVRSTTAGAVLVDGERVGQVETLGADGVLDRVQAAATG